TLINAIADALACFGEVPLELPLTPPKLLSVIEGRNIAGAAQHAKPRASTEITAASTVIDEPTPPAASPAEAPVGVQAAEAVPPAVAPIDGDWKMVLATPVGPQEMRGHFETDGASLSGFLSSEQGQQDFTGTVEGNRLKF